jgi:hypothetical protein
MAILRTLLRATRECLVLSFGIFVVFMILAPLLGYSLYGHVRPPDFHEVSLEGRFRLAIRSIPVMLLFGAVTALIAALPTLLSGLVVRVLCRLRLAASGVRAAGGLLLLLSVLAPFGVTADFIGLDLVGGLVAGAVAFGFGMARLPERLGCWKGSADRG